MDVETHNVFPDYGLGPRVCGWRLGALLFVAVVAVVALPGGG